MTTTRYVDLSRQEVEIEAKRYEPGDEDGFGILDKRGFWSSALYRSREGAERARLAAEAELSAPTVVPVILQGLSRMRLFEGGYVITAPDAYRSGMTAAEFERRFMPVDQWEMKKATAHEWLPPEWRRARVATPQENDNAA